MRQNSDENIRTQGSHRNYEGYYRQSYSSRDRGSTRGGSGRSSSSQSASEEVNMVDTTGHPLSEEEIDNVMQDLPPFECMSADPKHYSLVCEVMDDPNIPRVVNPGWTDAETERVVNPGSTYRKYLLCCKDALTYGI